MKKLGIIVGVLIFGFLLYRSINDPTQQLLEETSDQEIITVTPQNHNQIEDVPRHVVNQGLGIDEEIGNDVLSHTLREQIETFIRLYYDWNYAGMTGLALHEFVTDQFAYHVASELGDLQAHVHDHDHEHDDFVMPHATAYIVDLEIYVLVADDRWGQQEVIVTFDIYYDIPEQDPFSRHVVTRLVLSRDDFRVDDKKVLN